MAKFAPQYNIFKTVNCLSSISQFVFWIVVVLSIIPFFLKDFYVNQSLINILNIIGISFYFLLEIIIDYILIPQADSVRRDDFIDNSFGSIFSPINSVDYYDNDEISIGLYKAAVNLFENCFFSYSLVKISTIKKIVIPASILLLLVVFAYFGFKEVPIALSILQALFSANILGLLVKHLILWNRLVVIHDSWISLFQNDDIKSNTGKYQTHIYRYWLRYETLMSKIHAGIPSRIYNKHNPKLTKQWEEMKVKYKII